jgi:hypothetical protein
MSQPLPQTAMLPAGPPPRRTSGWSLWIGFGLVAVVLAACGGVGGVWLAEQEQKSDARPLSSASATKRAPSPSLSPSPVEPVAVTVVRPQTLLGRKRAGDRIVNGLLDKAFDGMKAAKGQTSASAAYGTLLKQNLVFFWASTANHDNPVVVLDEMVGKVSAAMSFHEVDPGPWGGVARCAGDGTAQQPTTLCMWVDHGSYGLVYFLFDDADYADELLAQARAEIEIAR